MTISIPDQFNEKRWSPTKKKNQSACPMLNTLSNYKLLPKKNITTKSINIALQKSNLFDDSIFLILTNIFNYNFNGYIKNIINIGKHGIIEHDVSLTRIDNNNGNSNHFNKKRFKKMLSFSKDNIHLTLEELAQYYIYQKKCSKKNNSNSNYGLNEMISSLAEIISLVALLKDDTNRIRLDWLKEFFTKEKLPFKKGYILKQINIYDFISICIKFVSLTIKYTI